MTVSLRGLKMVFCFESAFVLCLILLNGIVGRGGRRGREESLWGGKETVPSRWNGCEKCCLSGAK